MFLQITQKHVVLKNYEWSQSICMTFAIIFTFLNNFPISRLEHLGRFWSESCQTPAQMMRNKLNFDNQQKKFQNLYLPLRTKSFSE
jgi:hypothetical protein